MLFTIAIVLFILWALGFFVVHVGGGLIHAPARHRADRHRLSPAHGSPTGRLTGGCQGGDGAEADASSSPRARVCGACADRSGCAHCAHDADAPSVRRHAHPLGPRVVPRREERFRQRLVALIDELLDDPPVPGQSFLLDGQAIVLDDYLAVRPERAAEVAALLRDGRLEAGPWYVLADKLIPERRSARPQPPRSGATCCVAFARRAAAGALLSGFVRASRHSSRSRRRLRLSTRHRCGAATAARVRPSGDVGALARRTGHDGARSTTCRPTATSSAARCRLDTTRARSDGSDIDAIARVRARPPVSRCSSTAPTTTRVSATSAMRVARSRRRRRRRRVRRELAARRSRTRSSTRRAAPTLPSRRRRAARLVRLHVDAAGHARHARRAEARECDRRTNARARRRAMGARSRRHGGDASSRARCTRRGARSSRHTRTTRSAARRSTPSRTRFDARLADVGRSRAAGLRDDALRVLVGHDAERARHARSEWRPVVVVRNRVARTRGGVVELTLRATIADVAVGPGSASRQGARRRVASVGRRWHAAADPLARGETRRAHRGCRAPIPTPIASRGARRRLDASRWRATPSQASRREGRRALTSTRFRIRSRTTSARSTTVSSASRSGPRRGARRGSRAPAQRRAASISLESAVDVGDLYTPAIRESLAPPDARRVRARASRSAAR